jgi:hypothetical protein
VILTLTVPLSTTAGMRTEGWIRWSFLLSGIAISVLTVSSTVKKIHVLLQLERRDVARRNTRDSDVLTDTAEVDSVADTSDFGTEQREDNSGADSVTHWLQDLRAKTSTKDVLIPIEAPKQFVDRQVRFTVYRPDCVRPEVWNTMLAFAYRGGDDEEGALDIKESTKQVEHQAAALLGPQIQGFASLTTDSRHDIPRGEWLRFVPRVGGLQFNPPERSFQWVERIHRVDFRFRAPRELDGQVIHGGMEVYFGMILIAEIGLTIAVDSSVEASEADRKAAVHGRPYRKIFASYSHKDLPVVRQFEEFVLAFGDEFIRDWSHLRTGQIWSEQLQSMISEADIFQLFWSRNSMVSDFVRQEWEYALGLSRPSFIRPV